MAVTIKDVARRCGVSPSTVSRVIADDTRISQRTKEKVREAMEELKFTPNAIARSLARQRTKTLGIIIPNSDENLFENPFFIKALKGISVYSQKRGYSIMYTYSTDDNKELEFLKDYIGSNKVDGIILLTSRKDDKCIDYLREIEFPFSLIGRPSDNQDLIPWVDNDNHEAMRDVVKYHHAMGSRKIAFIGGSRDFNFVNDRYEGFVNTMKELGNEIDESLIRFSENFDYECGYSTASEMLDKQIPDSIITVDDMLALGVVRCLEERGIDGVRVSGFNAVELLRMRGFRFSTVDIKAEKLGYYGAKLLIDSLGKKTDKKHYIVETKLIK